MKVLSVLLAFALLAACSHRPESHKSVLLEGHAETGGFAVGTLAIVGSFDFETAPVYTRVVMLGHQADKALNAGAITKAEAESIVASAKQAESLADAAFDACVEDAKGKCTGDKDKAEALLAQATAVLASI